MKIGVVGGGQLGRMLGLAGIPLGFQFRFLEPSAQCPAGQLGEVVRTPFDDQDGMERFAQDLSLATYEFENVPVESARWLSQRLRLDPSVRALAIAQDRIAEKTTFRELGIPVQRFASISIAGDIDAACAALSGACVLKTRRMGYDGKGQAVIRPAGTVPSHAEVLLAWESLGKVPCILEEFVNFSAEVSMIAVRARAAGAHAEFACYPLVQNDHRSGILWRSRAPAPCDADGGLTTTARDYIKRLMESLDYFGVMAVEFFVTSRGLVANEMAPRVHNSGHWTIDGATTSQFENHLRAIAGLGIGPTEPRGASAMINLVGRMPISAQVLEIPGAHLHLYGKSPRSGRKIGHVTLNAPDESQLADSLARLERLVEWA